MRGMYMPVCGIFRPRRSTESVLIALVAGEGEGECDSSMGVLVSLSESCAGGSGGAKIDGAKSR